MKVLTAIATLVGAFHVPVILGSPAVAADAEAHRSTNVRDLATEEQLRLAYLAVFGDGPAILADEQGRAYQFEGGTVVWLHDRAVLVAPGAQPEGWPSEFGTLGLFYLQPGPKGFTEIARFPFNIDGSKMGNPPEWSVSHAFLSDLPVIVTTSGGVWQGYRCMNTMLTGVYDAGPGELISFRSEYNATGAGQDEAIAGKIVTVIKDKSFDVQFGGTRRFTHHYERSFDGYDRRAGNEADELPEC